MRQIDPKAIYVFFLTSLLPWFGSVLLPIAIINFVVPLTYVPAIGETGNIFNTIKFILKLLWIVPPISLFLCFVWAKLTYNNYKYEIKDTGVYKASGIFFKNEVDIPFDKIQNIVIARGPLNSMFGLSDMHIETAGGSGNMNGGLGAGTYGFSSLDPSSLLEMTTAEAVIPGINKEIADQLKVEIMGKSKKLNS